MWEVVLREIFLLFRGDILIKIQQVQPNNQQLFKKAQKTYISTPNFKGGIKNSENIKPIVEEALIKHIGFSGTVLNFLSKTVGEAQNLLIIAFGTAFVCPLFIAFNPFSKQDKKTKKYSAARQPISAVISTAIAWGFNNRVDSWLRKSIAAGKKGTIDRFNMEAKPPIEFLNSKYSRIIKKFGKLKDSDKKYFDLVNADGQIETVQDFKTKFPHSDDFQKAVHAITLRQAGIALLNPDNPTGLLHKTVKEFLIENPNLRFELNPADSKILNPDLTKHKLENILAIDFLKELGFSKKEAIEKRVRTFLGNNFYRDKIRFDSNERKFIVRTSELFISPTERDKPTITLKYLFKVLDIEDNFYKNHKILDKSIDKFLLWIKDKLEIPIPDKEFLEKHATQIVDNNMERMSSDFKAYTKMQGIVLSLLTLPFSCSLLNWAYPRIMEKCCPSLCTSNKTSTNSKGGK